MFSREFTLELIGYSEPTDDLVEALARVGCDVGLLHGRNGRVFLEFAGEAATDMSADVALRALKAAGVSARFDSSVHMVVMLTNTAESSTMTVSSPRSEAQSAAVGISLVGQGSPHVAVA